MDLPEGKPRQISAQGAREFHPSWSPDGKWLAYVSWSPEGGHIWKRAGDGGGQPIRLTRAAAFYRDPVWSLDGKRIVALRALVASGSRTRWISDPAPGSTSSGCPPTVATRPLISPARGASRPHFAGDPDRIYVTTPQGLVSMRFDGTDRRTHLQVTGKTAYRPSEPEPAEEILLRPDGRWVLARVATQLYLLAMPRFGGEAPKVSVHEPSVPDQEAHRYRRRLRRMVRRRQDDHLGHWLQPVPPPVRFRGLSAPQDGRGR